MRGVTSSSIHCRRKPSRHVPSENTMSLCALCSSAAAAVAIGQLQLQLSHYSLVALQAFCYPKWDFWGGLERASIKNFLGSLSLAIFSAPLINYAVIRPLVSRGLRSPLVTGLLLTYIMMPVTWRWYWLLCLFIVEGQNVIITGDCLYLWYYCIRTGNIPDSS